MRLPFLDSKMDLRTVWLPSPHLTWKIKEEETVIVDSQEGKVYHFNGVGALIWEGITRGFSGFQIVSSVSEDFESPVRKIENDVRSFLSKLHDQDLIFSPEGNLPC